MRIKLGKAVTLKIPTTRGRSRGRGVGVDFDIAIPLSTAKPSTTSEGPANRGGHAAVNFLLTVAMAALGFFIALFAFKPLAERAVVLACLVTVGILVWGWSLHQKGEQLRVRRQMEAIEEQGRIERIMSAERHRRAQAEEEVQRRKAKEKADAYQHRVTVLRSKYDEDTVQKILTKTLWAGETAAQLLDSHGNPEDTDTRTLKTKVREVWKYYEQGKNRYGLRVTLENGVVIGWDEKL